MQMRSVLATLHVASIVAIAAGGAAGAAELRVLSAAGKRPVIQDVAPAFERRSGHRLAITYASAGAAVKRVQTGETFDVLIMPRPGLDSLVRNGSVNADNAVVVARSGIGVAVRKGAPKPDISSTEAFKRALLDAKSITYSRPEGGGASGIHFAKVLDRLGIADAVRPKTVFDDVTNAVGLTVASGKAAIGVHQIQELASINGIEIVGPLPGDLQYIIVWSTATTTSTREPHAGKALIDFLHSAETAAAMKAKGLEPAGQ